MPTPALLGTLQLLSIAVAWTGARSYVGWRYGDDAHPPGR
jgi:hypothetical protein